MIFLLELVGFSAGVDYDYSVHLLWPRSDSSNQVTRQKKKFGCPQISRSAFILLSAGQAIALVAQPLLPLAVSAQAITNGNLTPEVQALAERQYNNFSNIYMAQGIDPGRGQGTTVLPTDVLPLPAAQERMSFGENLQLRALQRLPARFYFNTSIETSWRYETNPFQFPTKRKLFTQLPAPPIIRVLSQSAQAGLLDTVNLSSNDDWIFRALPNVTAGWTVTPRTRVFANYFLIRDYLYNHHRLNTTIQSIAGGVQQDIPITRRGNLQLEFQFRELYQQNVQPVFDFLPAATFSYIVTPRTVAFVNTLLQLRGKKYFQAPTKELDPFYTFGFLYQRGAWAFSNTATFVQNFREPFRGNATIPVNNYSWICDFEVARRIVKFLPGMQAFMRAEPIWNFKSHNRPGLAGMDFRVFAGLRMSVGKPPLTAALEQIRQQLEEQEGTPPPAAPPGQAEPKPSAFLMPYQLIAGSPQPIHGFMNADSASGPVATLVPSLDGPKFTPAVNTQPVAPVVNASYSRPAEELPASKAVLPVVQKETPAIIAMAPPSVALPPAVRQLDVESDDLDDREINSAIQKQLKIISRQQAKAAKARKQIAEKIEKVAKLEKIESSLPEVKPSKEMKMILLPPLPAVNSDSKENPFENSGIDVTAPPMLRR